MLAAQTTFLRPTINVAAACEVLGFRSGTAEVSLLLGT